MTLTFVCRGKGSRLLLARGLGGTWRSWSAILSALSEVREVIVIDLPGHGGTHRAPDSGTFAGLADSVDRFIAEQELEGVISSAARLGNASH